MRLCVTIPMLLMHHFIKNRTFTGALACKSRNFYGAIEVPSAKSILFMPRLPDSYAVWSGKISTQDDFKTKYDVDEVHYEDEIGSILGNHKATALLLLKGQNTDSDEWIHPPALKELEKFRQDTTTLYPVISECRVFKSPLELEVIRYACRVSCEAHIAMMKAVRPGMYEYQLESIFKHHVYYHGGMRHLGYCCIAATGCNSAVLHYGHAGAPNDRRINDGDLCLRYGWRILLLHVGYYYHVPCQWKIHPGPKVDLQRRLGF